VTSDGDVSVFATRFIVNLPDLLGNIGRFHLPPSVTGTLKSR